jgi:hypothetical protein
MACTPCLSVIVNGITHTDTSNCNINCIAKPGCSDGNCNVDVSTLMCSECEPLFKSTPQGVEYCLSKCIVPGSPRDPGYSENNPLTAAQEKNKKAISITILLVVLIIAAGLIYYL